MALRLLQIVVLVLAGITTAGCEVIGNIFQAGIWVGVILVVLVIAVVGFIVGKLRR